MDAAGELSEFLTSRRARLTPDEVGLPSYGQRRVPGLRREEVASLAGVSVEYYKRLERGNATGASDTVLQALADALRLDDAERAHLLDLARTTNPTGARRQRRVPRSIVRPSVHRVLESVTAPAIVSTMHGDYLAANPIGRALYAPLFDSPEQPANSARFTFLDPAAQEFFTEWDKAAKDLVAALRSQAGRNPFDRGLSDLIGELSTRSDAFRIWWGQHNVRYHHTGIKRLHHPIVGDLELDYEVMHVTADSDLRLAIFTAPAASRSQQALDLLASWTGTPADTDTVHGPH